MIIRIAKAARRADDGKRADGFTLIELLVVIAILGILSGVVVFAVRGAGDRGKAAAVATDERVIRTAEETYCAQNGRYADEGELVPEYLSAAPKIHTVVATDDPDAEGQCGNAVGKTRYKILCRDGSAMPDCGVPLLSTTTTIPTDPLGRFVPGDDSTFESRAPRLSNLGGGKVFHVGTVGSPGVTSRQIKAEIYDPAGTGGSGRGRWSAVAAPVGLGPNSATEHAITLVTGNVLVGFTGPVLWMLYNPIGSGSWSVTGGANYTDRNLGSTAAPITGPASRCGANCGKVLWAGGQDNFGVVPPEELQADIQQTAELYDPSTGLFTATARMGVGRWHHASIALPDGRVLVAGGAGGRAGANTTYEIYDAGTASWSPTKPLPTGFSIDRTQSAQLTVLADGRVLAIGADGPGAGTSSFSSVYSPATDMWSSVISCGCSPHTATLLANGKVLVTEATGSKLYTPGEAPAPGSWTDGPPLLTPRIKHAAIRLDLSDGPVLLAGSDSPTKSTELYEPGGS